MPYTICSCRTDTQKDKNICRKVSKTIMKYIALAVLIIAASAHATGTGGTGATGATGGKF